jgi:UDP-2,3-diacylglucosamine hydrolase
MKKTYFASDFHLGTDGRLNSRDRERQIVRWLDSIRPDAEALYLVGDLFDYWFEYRKVVPKGYVRLLGKLAELRDDSLPVYYFTGNHDMWMFRYLEDEFDIPTYRQPIERQIGGKQFFIGHGDGLGPGDYGYKFIKKVFSNPACQWLFERLHPNAGIRLMNYFSGTSRKANHPSEKKFHGEEKERLIHFCNEHLERTATDFFIFGHRHLPIDFRLKNQKSRYINLGDWLVFNSYAVFDGQNLDLNFFENAEGRIFGNM